MKPDYYYLESDGQVFLVRDKNLWRFPRARRELPCTFRPVFVMPVDGEKVLFAHPVLKRHPEHWFHKDDLVARADVAPTVQRAVNLSLPRGAAKVAIVEKGRVLMVKGRRGITRGIWNLPGGFIGYGEHPAQSARREAREELGTRVRLNGLLGIYAQTFRRTGGYMISFIYSGKRLAKKLRPLAEEIEAVRWMPIREAMRATRNPFVKAGLRDYLRQPYFLRRKTSVSREATRSRNNIPSK